MAGAAAREHREAIARLRGGDWQAAHAIVKDLEDPLACRIHALCHRLEGDTANARYWYRRAKVRLDDARGIDDELAELAAIAGPLRAVRRRGA